VDVLFGFLLLAVDGSRTIYTLLFSSLQIVYTTLDQFVLLYEQKSPCLVANCHEVLKVSRRYLLSLPLLGENYLLKREVRRLVTGLGLE
jgi:hypothetical protein